MGEKGRLLYPQYPLFISRGRGGGIIFFSICWGNIRVCAIPLAGARRPDQNAKNAYANVHMTFRGSLVLSKIVFCAYGLIGLREASRTFLNREPGGGDGGFPGRSQARATWRLSRECPRTCLFVVVLLRWVIAYNGWMPQRYIHMRSEFILSAGGFSRDCSRPCIENMKIGRLVKYHAFRSCLRKQVRQRLHPRWCQPQGLLFVCPQNTTADQPILCSCSTPRSCVAEKVPRG